MPIMWQLTNALKALMHKYLSPKRSLRLLKYGSSYCSVMEWVWDNGNLHLASKEEAPAEVLISEGRATAKTILPQIELGIFLRKLGMLTNPLKKWTDVFDKRLEKTTEMSQCINKAYITPKNVMQIYKQV
eukprot:203606-Ditylum_brightwellii.AAC.1